jgi:4-amino-4-deoxy-L-arabinose transferase-like glycosyltransferase
MLERFFPRNDNRFDYSYAYKAIMTFSFVGALELVTFTWPVFAVILDRRLLRRRYSWLQHLIELLLCGWTFYWGIYLTLGRWLYGAYVAMMAVAAFAITSLVFLFEGIRNLVRRNKG